MKCLLVGVIYPLSRRPAFIGINKANVSVCPVGVMFVGGGVVLVSMIFGASVGVDDALGDCEEPSFPCQTERSITRRRRRGP